MHHLGHDGDIVSRVMRIYRRWHLHGRAVMYKSIEEIEAANEAIGQHWFSPDTMRFWGSRVDDEIYPVGGGAYFVSSESSPWDKRVYSVRFAHASGRIRTVGDLGEFPTRKQAHHAAQHFADNHVM